MVALVFAGQWGSHYICWPAADQQICSLQCSATRSQRRSRKQKGVYIPGFSSI